jgi:hypothetical protein
LGTLLRNWKVIPQKNIDIPKTAYKAFQGHPVMYKKNNINPKLNKTQTEPVSLSGLTSKQIAQIAYSVDHFNLELAKPLTKTVPDFGSKIKNINTPNHQIISTTSKRKAITSLKNILEVSNDLHNLPIKRANDTWDNMSLSTSRTGIAVQFNEKVEIQYIAKYIRDLSTN